MSGVRIPAVMRGAALEGRDGFPITYEAGSDADAIVEALHAVIERGGMFHVLTVTNVDGTVTCTRDDIRRK